MRTLLAVTMIALLATAACALQQPFTCVFKDQAGKERTFRTKLFMKSQVEATAKTAVPPMLIDARFLTAEHVNDLQGNAATISFSLVEGQADVALAGKIHKLQLPAFTMTYSRQPNGAISGVTVDGDKTGALKQLNPLLSSFDISKLSGGAQFPDRPLFMGSNWTTTMETEPVPGATVKATQRYWLSAIKVVDGKPYLQIDVYTTMTLPKTTMPAPAMPDNTLTVKQPDQTMDVSAEMSGYGYMLFDPESGDIFRYTFKGILSMGMTPTDANSTTSPLSVRLRYFGVTKKAA